MKRKLAMLMTGLLTISMLGGCGNSAIIHLYNIRKGVSCRCSSKFCPVIRPFGLYAINAGVNVPTVVYNKTLLDENGITINDNMTLEEFYAVCRDVYEKTGYKTDVFYGNGADYLGYGL